MKKVLQIPIPDSNLDQVRAIVKIRNALVHKGGYIDQIPDHLGPLQQSVGLADDGRLELGGSFTEEASSACKALVLAVEEAARSQSAPWIKVKK